MQIIEHTFGEQPNDERKCFRLSNFTESETLEFLSLLEEGEAGPSLASVKVVIANDASESFPQEFRAKQDETITTYRNGILPGEGLIYIETKVESDSQGLKNLFTLRDINFLDGSFDSDDFRAAFQIVSGAFELQLDEPDASTDLLILRCLEVLDGLRLGETAVPVRKFAAFALAVANALSENEDVLDAGQIDSLVGRELISLDIFPDENWRNVVSGARVSRRLNQNLLHAELASSQSSDLDQDKLVEQCLRTVFRDSDGADYSESEQTKWRNLCSSYCENPNALLRSQIPYPIFEQLFLRDLKGLSLGDRVEQEIDQGHPDRLAEFEKLGVKSGLNRRVAEEARRFLDAEPDEEGVAPLRDLLSNSTRRMVEKAANPNPEPFENPLLKVAEVAARFRSRLTEADRELKIEMRLGPSGDPGAPGVGLLSFLFGPTLGSVSEASAFTADGFVFTVSEQILQVHQTPEPEDDEEESDEGQDNQTILWEPVPVEFVLIDVETGNELDSEGALEWSPSAMERLALFWLMTASPTKPDTGCLLRVPDNLSFSNWISDVVSGHLGFSSCIAGTAGEAVLNNSIISGATESLVEFKRRCASEGLSVDALSELCDRWNGELSTAKQSFVPQGSADPHLAALLRQECVESSDGSGVLMLASHPLRARWIAEYLRKSEELAQKALGGELPLNSQNETLYLRWISNLSPHQNPAIHVSSGGVCLLAAGEEGWTEQFAPQRTQSSIDAGGSISAVSLDEISRQIVSYLDAHPYKRDGLSLLIVSPGSPGFSADLVRTIRRGDWRDLRLTVHLALPRDLWEEATNSFEQLPAEGRMSGEDPLLPPLQLQLHEFGSNSVPSEVFGDLEVDISVVPQFLHDDIEVQEHTSPPIEESGSFDPLLDRPTFIYGGTEGGAISVAQRPRNPDEVFSDWSSVVVRQHRLSPVSQQQPENTDFLELRINFQNAARLFADLHERSHWVITLERYITREQIEALENRPEILTVRDRVGPGGMFTLIVSSNAGRKFIINRLERKLAKIVDDAGLSGVGAIDRELAERIFEETRQIAPWLTLKAMGVSRVTEEILGLVVGRHFVEQQFPSSPEKGMVAWVSLDDHQDWFGGENGTRADLCRITLDQSDEDLSVDIVVLESKLRKDKYDSHGVVQVSATMALLKDAMPSGEDETEERVDASLWRENILSAIENVNPDAVRVFGSNENEDGHVHRVPVDVRSAFRDGRFNVRDFRGLYSICLYSVAGDIQCSESENDPSVYVARSYGSDLLAMVAGEADTAVIEESDNRSNEGGDSEGSAVEGDPAPDDPAEELRVTPSNEELPPSGDDEASTAEVTVHRKLSDDELKLRYQRILSTYAEFNIQVHAPDEVEDRYVEGPASILFRLKGGHGVSPEKIMQQGETLKLKLELLEEQDVRFSIDRGFITIDVPKSQEDRYFVSASELWLNWQRPENQLEVPLGVDRYGAPVSLNFSSSNSPHLLIGGTTGSGKSEALNTLLGGLVEHYDAEELNLSLVDPKGTELEHFEGSDHLRGDIGWDDQDTIVLLEGAVAEMERRYQLFKAAKQRSLPAYNEAVGSDDMIPWWVIVLDEYADLTSDKDAKKKIEENLKRLAQKARAAGIHLIIATQKPSADVISTNLRSNLPAQLALKVKSATESRVVMDEAGGESLNGMGDAFLKSEGKLTRVQCAKV